MIKRMVRARTMTHLECHTRRSFELKSLPKSKCNTHTHTHTNMIMNVREGRNSAANQSINF